MIVPKRKKKGKMKNKDVKDSICLDESIFNEKGNIKSKRDKKKMKHSHPGKFPRSPINY